MEWRCKYVNTNENHIVCYYTNAQSIINKLEEFERLVAELQPHIVGITETWGNETVSDALLCPNNYDIFRRDRRGRTGGGVLLLVHKELRAIPCVGMNDSTFEDSVWCTVDIGHHEHTNMLVGVCYRSPGSSAENNNALIDLFSEIENIRLSRLMIMGDFNLPNVDFINYYTDRNENTFDYKFMVKVQDLLLVQHVDIGTRDTACGTSNVLDLIFTDDENSIEELDIMAPLGRSDHIGLTWKVVARRDFTQRTDSREDLNFWKGKYKELNERLICINWDTLFGDCDINEMWRKFTRCVWTLCETWIPLVKRSRKKKMPGWVTQEVKRASRDKNILFRVYKRTRRLIDWEKYTDMRNRTTDLCRKAKLDYEKKLIMSFKDNPKKFYGYVRNKQKIKVGVSQIDKGGGSMTASDKEAAEVLCKFFKSVFVKEANNTVPDFDLQYDGPKIDTVNITEVDVKSRLEKLKEDKSPGPDKFHPKLLKGCAAGLAKPLCMLFNKSLYDSKLPDEWKRSQVVPIFKKGSRVSPGNYRPVALTSIVAKIMEGIVRDVITKHLMSENLLSAQQHGFRQGRSCLTNLLETLENWTEALDMGHDIDAVYLDFKKAFDTVPHKRLLYKMEAYGIKGLLIRWIEDFLMGREMRVGVHGEYSDWCKVDSGVPQGSVLGPTLFLIFVNDIPSEVKCQVKMFADDTKVWNVLRTDQDVKDLQTDIDTLQDWSSKWLLDFNIEKCKTLHMGSNNVQHDYFMSVGGARHGLEKVEVEKDLGVQISRDLKPSKQCLEAAKRANNVLRSLKRSFVCIEKDGFQILYKCYVRPHLEYCVQAWAPYYRKDITHLERIQRRATKLVKGLQHLTYEERLVALDIQSLERRRVRGDLIETYKVLTGKESIESAQFFTPAASTHLRGNVMKLFKSRSKLLLRQNFFSQRVVNQWNRLPQHVIQASSVNVFKSRLDKYLKDMGLYY